MKRTRNLFLMLLTAKINRQLAEMTMRYKIMFFLSSGCLATGTYILDNAGLYADDWRGVLPRILFFSSGIFFLNF